MTPQFYIALCPKCDRCVGSAVANPGDRWVTAQFLFSMVLAGYIVKPIQQSEYPGMDYKPHTCNLNLPELRTYGVLEDDNEKQYIEWVKMVVEGEDKSCLLGFEDWREKETP